MTMAPNYLYLRLEEETGKYYITGYLDEERVPKGKDGAWMVAQRKYGTIEELKKYNSKREPNTDIIYTVVDETAPKFREKWVKFKKDRVVGYEKNGRILTPEMLELLGYDGKGVNLDTLTSHQKDTYYRLIACAVMRKANDLKRMEEEVKPLEEVTKEVKKRSHKKK